MSSREYVIVGALSYRAGAYALDKFLENHKEIQKRYPSSYMLLATKEKDFIDELKEMLTRWGLRGEVMLYDVVKPDYASSWVWNVACGREMMRQYVLSQATASHLFLIDTDMTCDPNVINILTKEIEGYDIVVSGYPGRLNVTGTGGIGCSLFTRDALQKIKFRCYEFDNHVVIDEGVVLEMDSFSKRLRFKRGYFVAIDHYYDSDGSSKHIEPHSVNMLRKISNSLLVRYILIRTSLIFKHNIPDSLQQLLSRFFKHP